MKGLYFIDLSHHRYDPKGILATHCKKAGFSWSYVHTKDIYVKNLETGTMPLEK